MKIKNDIKDKTAVKGKEVSIKSRDLAPFMVPLALTSVSWNVS